MVQTDCCMHACSPVFGAWWAPERHRRWIRRQLWWLPSLLHRDACAQACTWHCCLWECHLAVTRRWRSHAAPNNDLAVRALRRDSRAASIPTPSGPERAQGGCGGGVLYVKLELAASAVTCCAHSHGVPSTCWYQEHAGAVRGYSWCTALAGVRACTCWIDLAEHYRDIPHGVATGPCGVLCPVTGWHLATPVMEVVAVTIG
jgi:hypothetical protein